MPLVALAVIEAVSIGVSAYGQHKAGQAAKKAGQSQQVVANLQGDQLDFNARVADLQEQDALARGVQDEQKFRSTVAAVIGTQRAGFGGQGVDVSSGSAAEVQADAAHLGELDARTIRANAKREAWGYSVQAADYRTSAEVARKGGVIAAQAGRNAATAANIGAVGTIAAGTGSLLLQRYQFTHGAT